MQTPVAHAPSPPPTEHRGSEKRGGVAPAMAAPTWRKSPQRTPPPPHLHRPQQLGAALLLRVLHAQALARAGLWRVERGHVCNPHSTRGGARPALLPGRAEFVRRPLYQPPGTPPLLCKSLQALHSVVSVSLPCSPRYCCAQDMPKSWWSCNDGTCQHGAWALPRQSGNAAQRLKAASREGGSQGASEATRDEPGEGRRMGLELVLVATSEMVKGCRNASEHSNSRRIGDTAKPLHVAPEGKSDGSRIFAVKQVRTHSCKPIELLHADIQRRFRGRQLGLPPRLVESRNMRLDRLIGIMPKNAYTNETVEPTSPMCPSTPTQAAELVRPASTEPSQPWGGDGRAALPIKDVRSFPTSCGAPKPCVPT